MNFLRNVLRSGSAVFGLSAIALIIAPGFFLSLLGLSDSAELRWSMVMIGVTLVALTGMMAVVSTTASDAGVRVASVVMALSAAGLGVATVFIPSSHTWFSVLYAVVGFSFSVAYVVGLLGLARAR